MRWLNFLKKKKVFRATEKCLEFESKDREVSRIWFRKPTGDEVLSFSYSALDLEKSDLRVNKDNVSTELLHRDARIKKFIPYAKKVVTKVDGYEENTVDFVEKFFTHHLETLAIIAYETNDTCKKKY